MTQPSFAMAAPSLAFYESFLTEAECALLIWMAHDKLKRSSVVDQKAGGRVTSEARTSSGMFFKRGENAIIASIEDRISAATGIPVENGEDLQILRYDVGQEYKPHFDYFTTRASAVEERVANNRVCTFLMYLNTPDEGGETIFPDAHMAFAARLGNAIRFSYKTPTPETLTLHGSTPVVRGVKWVATKWIRREELK